MTQAEILVFSGRENPTLRLPDETTRELKRRVAAAPRLEHQREDAPPLGYLGVAIWEEPGPNAFGAPVLEIGGGLIEISGELREDAGRVIEAWLLQRLIELTEDAALKSLLQDAADGVSGLRSR